MTNKIFAGILIICAFTSINCQRSPYAGNRPNGYKDRFENNTQQTTQTVVNRFDSDPNYVQRPPFNMNNVVVAEPNFTAFVQPTQSNNNNLNSNVIPSNTIINRFGENNASGQVQNLPHEAYGDKDLVDRYNRQPVNNRPFWLVNQAAIEAQKGGSGLQNQQATNQQATIQQATNQQATIQQATNQQATVQQSTANRQNTIAGLNLPRPTQAQVRREINSNVPNNAILSQRFGSDLDTKKNNEQIRPVQFANQGKFPNGGVTNPDLIQQFAQYHGPSFDVPNNPSYDYYGGFRRPNSLWQEDPFYEPHPEFF